MRALAAAALLTAALACAGCGYSLRGNLPEHIKSVAIPIFQNRTPVPAIENFLTNAVVNAFSTNGRLRVTNVDRADSILEGTITNYNLQSIAYDSAANIRQFRLTVTLNLRFRDVRRNEMLFERNGFSDRADFAVPGTVAETITTSEGALQQAATDIARSVVSLAVERF